MAKFTVSFILCLIYFICPTMSLSSAFLVDPINEYYNISNDPNDVGFYLYTNPSDPYDAQQLLYLDNASILNSGFNPANPVIILSHGFGQSYFSQFPYYVKKAYLNAGYGTTANVIAVDWSKLSGTLNGTVAVQLLATLPTYISAVQNVYIVGKRVADFVNFLIQNGFSSGPEKFHLVGQSLGAQVSGMAGLYYREETGQSLARITGTDPASPLFQSIPSNKRLDSTDANFVDVYHTNEGEMGYLGSVGDVDFVINGGTLQPPCDISNITDVFCSHNLAPRYFAVSIANSTILACDVLFCSSTATFGEHCPTNTRGTFYLYMTTFQQ